VVRSPLQPEEVRGLARSGDLSRMLPSEIMLMAHGWPRKGGGASRPESPGGAWGSNSGSGGAAVRDAARMSADLGSMDEEYFLPGAQLSF
jgi:hypothetical protein